MWYWLWQRFKETLVQWSDHYDHSAPSMWWEKIKWTLHVMSFCGPFYHYHHQRHHHHYHHHSPLFLLDAWGSFSLLYTGWALQERVSERDRFVVHVYQKPHGDDGREEEGEGHKHDWQGVGAEDRVPLREEENVGISIRQVFNAVNYHTSDDEK